MKKLIFLLLLTAHVFANAETEIPMPTNDVTAVSNGYALAAVCVSVMLPFILLLVKMIFDNKKNTELTEYIKKHDEEHKVWRDRNEKRLDKMDVLLGRLVDNDIEHEKRLAKLEAKE